MPRRGIHVRTPLRWIMAAAVLASAAASGAAAPGVAAGTAPVSAGCSGGTITPAGLGWLAIAPHFHQGGADVSLVSSPQFQPDTIYASNGTEILRSSDDGCTWRAVFEASTAAGATAGALPQSATITSLAAPSSANSSHYLYVGVDVTVAGVSEPVVAASGNGGSTWTYSGPNSGLPLVGSVSDVTATADLPLTSYAVVSPPSTGTNLGRAVYASTDGGQTWTARTPLGSSYGGTSLTASPTHDTEVFGLEGQTVQVSEDGGATFSAVPSPGSGQITSMALAAGGSGVRIAAAHGNDPAVDVANPFRVGGRWTTRLAPTVAEDVAYAPLQDILAVAGGGQLAIEPAGKSPRDVSPATGAVNQMVLSAPTSAGFSLTGLSAKQVVRATLAVGTGVPVPVHTLRPVRLLPAADVHQFPAVLTPGPRSVTLRPGASIDLPYRLFLPRVPTPLDVMFLIDTTGSMGNVIDGLRQDLVGIANALDVSGLDVEIGLGDFKDYPDPYGGGSPGDYPYQRDARVQHPGAALQAAIAGLSASGGGDGPESGLTALYQSTTGAGDVVNGHTFVPRGRWAGYRGDALHLAVTATDSPFHEGGERTTDSSGNPISYPGPTMAQTLAALVKHHVYQVGLAASGDSVADLTTVARGTRTFAPDGGVDCNGDGTIDLPAGTPLVCPVGGLVSGAAPVGVGVSVDGSGTGSGSGGAVPLTGAVVGLAEALPDYQPVTLQVTRGASVATVRTPALPAVNVKADNELGYTVHLSCPVAPKSRTVSVGLAAAVATRTVATDGISLTCLGLRSASSAPPLPLPLAPVRGIGAGGPPAPPEPVPNVNPQPQPNPNPNPNVNVNGAVAEQEQQQQQLALAYLDGIRAQDTVELAMSRRTPDPSSMLFLGAAALTALGAGAVATRRARSTALARTFA
ncbi:MAG: hypothetical protein QOD07_37 [Frankiaceae bacterium]|jgi:hypothetical protein|nr:hypothetical protein [Frankiaceae bacterium]